MKTLNKSAKYAGATLMALGAGAALAETVPSTATVTVQNAFTLNQVAGLNFGTIRAIATAAGSDAATITRPADATQSGVATDGTASKAQILVAGAPAQFSVSGAAGFAPMDITMPADNAIILSNASAPPGSPRFRLTGFEAYITSGPNVNTAYAAAGDLITDVSGGVTFNVGATLNTETATSSGDYIDAAYTGNFNITVEYN